MITCNIPVVQATELIHTRLNELKEPMVIKNMINDWKALGLWDTPSKFITRYNNYNIGSKRSSFSYNYDSEFVNIQEFAAYSSEEFIIVMDDQQRIPEEDKFLTAIKRDFTIPRLFENITYSRILSWGAKFQGVDFMRHCEAWLGLVHGTKMWQFANPNIKSIQTSCTNPNPDPRIKKCTINASDVVFVPNNWWHATCNLDPHTIAVGTQCYQTRGTHNWIYVDNNQKEEL